MRRYKEKSLLPWLKSYYPYYGPTHLSFVQATAVVYVNVWTDAGEGVDLQSKGRIEFC